MKRARVLIPRPIAPIGIELLSRECDCIAPWMTGEVWTDERIRDELRDVDAIVVRIFELRAEDIDSAPRLKVIAKHGVGVDNIDCSAAARRGIPVVITPGANSNAVAEHTLALIFALARQTLAADAITREGRFDERDSFAGVELAGKTVGVVGFGRIGSRVAAKVERGLGMRAVAYDPPLVQSGRAPDREFAPTLDDVAASADFLSLHVPLTPDTQHLVDREVLERLGPDAFLINTSRGSVVDERALVGALESGQIRGAALDVFETEPLPADHPLCGAPRTLLSPHVAAATSESRVAMARMVAEGVLAALRGEAPPHVAE